MPIILADTMIGITNGISGEGITAIYSEVYRNDHQQS
jgi:hypothetical protein